MEYQDGSWQVEVTIQTATLLVAKRLGLATNTIAVFHPENWFRRTLGGEANIVRYREVSIGYIGESTILEGGNLCWGWEIPGPPTLCMKPCMIVD